jgi:hypothetical protein
MKERVLLRKREHRLEQEHHVKGPEGIGGTRATSNRHGSSPVRRRAISMALELKSTPR